MTKMEFAGPTTDPSATGGRSLSDALRHLSPRTEAWALLGVFLVVPAAFYAFQLLPSHDCFNTYIYFHQFIISSLLRGELPFWDPMAACGSPLFMSYLTCGFFEPFLPIAVGLGKLGSWNILQIYEAWIILRLAPFLLGMFVLTKRLARHSVAAIVVSASAYLILAVSSLHDHIIFALYWPLLMAAALFFREELLKGRVSLSAYYGALVFFSVSLMQYNPAYTIVFAGMLALSWLLFAPADAVFFARSCRCVPAIHLVAGLVLIAALLAPAAVMTRAYSEGNYVGYLRAQHAWRDGRQLSRFLGDSLDYIRVDPERSPTRNAHEIISTLYPFQYGIGGRTEGTLYLGLTTVIGLLAAMAGRLRRSGKALIVASLGYVFLMSPAANPVIVLLAPILKFLLIFNQRHLLYPAVLVTMSAAGAMGLAEILDIRTLRKIASWGTPARMLLYPGAIIAAGFLFLITSEIISPTPGNSTAPALPRLFAPLLVALSLLFVLHMAALGAVARAAMKNPAFFRWLVILLLVGGALDLGEFFLHATHDYNRNTGVLEKSDLIRESVTPTYVSYRTPLVPLLHPSTQHSVVRHVNARTALPAYEHGDVFFTTPRYYDLIGSLDPERLRILLGITEPIFRLVDDSVMLTVGQDAVALLRDMSAESLAKTVVLQRPKTSSPAIDPLGQRSFSGAWDTGARANLEMNAQSWDTGRSLYAALYDEVVSFGDTVPERVANGAYHVPLYRMIVTLPAEMATLSASEIAERCSFQNFPYFSVVHGVASFFSSDRATALRVEPGRGLLLEYGGVAAEAASSMTVPSRMMFLKKKEEASRSVIVTSFGSDRIEMETKKTTPTVLLASEIYDPNWSVSVDGVGTEVWIANHAFKAVPLSAGRHHVVLQYDIPWLRYAIMLYESVMMSSLGLMVFASWRQWPR